MIFADSHTHIYAEEFDADREAVMNRAMEEGVLNLFLPAIDAAHTERLKRAVSDFPHLCHPMAGLHPTSVGPGYRSELDHVESCLNDSSWSICAIGEIGIDLYWDRTYEREQVDAFQLQLDLSISHNLPVVIHTRNSIGVALEIIEKRNDSRLRGVFHCFSGGVDEARRAVRHGFMLGIGGVITYKNSGLRAVVDAIGAEHLLLETDAPWLPPVPHRGKRNEPSYIPLVAQKVAEIKGLTLPEVATVTTGNTLRLFQAKQV